MQLSLATFRFLEFIDVTRNRTFGWTAPLSFFRFVRQQDSEHRELGALELHVMWHRQYVKS